MPSTATAILDGLSTSVAVKPPCRTVATTNITLSGLQTISGYTTEENDRVLVKGQTNPIDNGIYMASTGSWTRAKDADGARDLVQGTRVIVRSATVDGVEYELTTANPIVIGTTALTFTLRYGANAVYDQTESEIAAGVIPTLTGFLPGQAERYGYVADGLDDDTDTGTDNATAIANALASNSVVDLPDGVGLFSGSITIPAGKMLRGKGARRTTLRQLTSATVPAIKLGDVVSADISEGAHGIRDICIKAADNAGAHGIEIGDGVTAWNASMLDFSNLRLWSQHEETLTVPPYTTQTNQRGIYIRSASSAVFVASLRNVEIRSFDIGIDSGGSPVGANEWSLTTTWIIGSRVSLRLSNSSTWNLSGCTVESGVSVARALQIFNSVANILWHGGRWEITEPNGYGIEGDGTTTGSNWRFSGINVLIDGDGSAIPGRKWTGTVPNDFIFEGTDTAGPFMVIPNSNQTMRLPQRIVIGGSSLGNGRITIGRNAGSADSTIEHDGTHLVVTGGNSIKLRGDGTGDDRLEINGDRVIVTGADGANGWEAAILFGTNSYLWVDSTGDLRIKQGAPTSDLDGTVVGTQS